MNRSLNRAIPRREWPTCHGCEREVDWVFRHYRGTGIGLGGCTAEKYWDCDTCYGLADLEYFGGRLGIFALGLAEDPDDVLFDDIEKEISEVEVQADVCTEDGLVHTWIAYRNCTADPNKIEIQCPFCDYEGDYRFQIDRQTGGGSCSACGRNCFLEKILYEYHVESASFAWDVAKQLYATAVPV